MRETFFWTRGDSHSVTEAISHGALLPFTGSCGRWADNVLSPWRTSLFPISRAGEVLRARCRERGADAQPGARWQRRTAPGPPQPERAGRCGSVAPASAGSWPGHCCALLCSTPSSPGRGICNNHSTSFIGPHYENYLFLSFSDQIKTRDKKWK